MDNHWKAWIINSIKSDTAILKKKVYGLKNRSAVPDDVKRKLLDVYYGQINILDSELNFLSDDKSPSSCRQGDPTNQAVTGSLYRD